jgi:hypothetical protein
VSSAGASEAEGRYGVVRYFDAFGAWYAVVDRQSSSLSNIVRACRSRRSAHRHAATYNESARSARSASEAL